MSHPNKDIGKAFFFLRCWALLRDIPRFISVADGKFSHKGETRSSQEGTNMSTVDEEKKPEQKVLPDGRRKSKDDLAAQQMWYNKIKISESSVCLQELKVALIMRGNEIFLFINGAGRS